MDFDEIDESLDSEVGEGHRAVVADPVDPYHAVFDVHFVGDVEPPFSDRSWRYGARTRARRSIAAPRMHDDRAAALPASGEGLELRPALKSRPLRSRNER
jgi:hypothetical protein